MEWKEDALGWYASGGYWIIQRKPDEFAWRKGGTGDNQVFKTLELAKKAAENDAQPEPKS